MSPRFGFVAGAILAFSAPGLANYCDTVTVTVTSIISTCETSTPAASSNMNYGLYPYDFPTAQASSSANPGTPGTPTNPPAPLITNSDCQPDNCLRAFENTAHFPEGSSFCATFTTAVVTATTGLPEPISNCMSEPILISSACSCFVGPLPTTVSTNSTSMSPYTNSTMTSTTMSATESTNGTVTATPTPSSSLNSTATSSSPPQATFPMDCQPDNCLRAFENNNFSGGPEFCALYTLSPPAVTAIPDGLRNCEANPVYLSSACSCINTSLPGFPTAASNSSSAATTTMNTVPNSTPGPEPFANCHQDNCFREAVQSQSQFSAFCSTYTTAIVTATDSLPSFVGMCSEASVLSSACSCIVSATATAPAAVSSSAAPTTGGGFGNNGGVSTSASADSCPAVSVIYETYTEIATVSTTVIGLSVTPISTLSSSLVSWGTDSSSPSTAAASVTLRRRRGVR